MGTIQLVVLVFPVAAIVLGLIGFYIFENIYIMPVVVGVTFIILMCTVFNPTFLMWMFVYAFLTWMAGLIAKGLQYLF